MTSILTDVFPSSLYLGALQLCRKVSVFPECQINYILMIIGIGGQGESRTHASLVYKTNAVTTWPPALRFK
jgi:hypothetical protein